MNLVNLENSAEYSKYDVILSICTRNCIQAKPEWLCKFMKARSKKIV